MNTNEKSNRPHDEATRQARLRTLLAEDTDSDEEAKSLLPVAQRLDAWKGPTVSESETAWLITRLAAELPAPAAGLRPVVGWRHKAMWSLLVLRTQMWVIQAEIWAATALVMTLGVIVTLAASQGPMALDSLPLVLAAPVIAAVGMALIYSPDTTQMLEIETATPASARLILLARLSLVFGFNLALGSAGSVILAWLNPTVALWPLVLAWLAPMAFLSALAFCLTVVSGQPTLGIAISMMLWIAEQIGRYQAFSGSDGLWIRVPDLFGAQNYPALLLLAAVLGAMALWLAGSEDRVLRGTQ